MLFGLASKIFQYTSQQKVTRETVQGAGDSQTGGGWGTYTFRYTASNNSPGVNSWAMKTVVGNPDGSSDTVYTNTDGEVMLDDHYDPTGGVHSDEFYMYNAQGQLILAATPSAVTGYNDSYADLLDNYQYLSKTSGLITRIGYSTTTTATETTQGSVAGYINGESIQQGFQGTYVPQAAWTYFAHSANGQIIARAAEVVYRTVGGGRETTNYSYTWYAGTAQMQSQTVDAPLISSAENGPGSYDATTTYFDAFGNVQWVKDPDGYLQYYAYDLATGAQTTHIVDVNTADTSEFTNLPSGWTTPSSTARL